MTDSVDITMEDMVNQYREEAATLLNDKMMLQAAVKILGDQNGLLQQQIQQLTGDLQHVMAAKPGQQLDTTLAP